MPDLKNIALTIPAGQTAADLRHRLDLPEQMDVIRLGFAYAVRSTLSLERDGSFGARGGSNYDVGGLDPDGLMAATVRLYYPDPHVLSEPYRAVETLMNKGLLLLAQHQQEGIFYSVSDLVQPPEE